MKLFSGIKSPWFLALGTLMLSLMGTSVDSESGKSHLSSQKILTVITTTSPTTFIADHNGADGFEYQLVNDFAQKNNYKLNVVLAEKLDDVYSVLDLGLADIALLGQPLSISKQKNYPQTPAYMHSTSQLIYRSGDAKPASYNDMIGKKIVVQDNEQNREKYRYLKSYFADLHWEFSNQPVDNILKLVNRGKIDYTVVDSHIYQLKGDNFPKTHVAFDLFNAEPITIAYSKNVDKDLQTSFNAFLQTVQSDGTFNNLTERFYGHSENFDTLSATSFHFLVRNRLPLFHENIVSVAREYHLDWRLLAAIAFQESHWDPEATSKTGVRGMMMLTNGTAMDMGVIDRTDVDQSLRGGAKYFNIIYNDLPKSIKEPDRTWFAMAAYNIGTAHLMDARKITAFHSGNPDLWVDVKKSLPLLELQDWHQYTEYGYARGGESVHYVQSIRHFYDLLVTNFPNSESDKIAYSTSISVKMLDQFLQEKNNQDTIRKSDFGLASLLF